MKCPYCNDEMSSGLLYGRGPGAFYWMPESEKLPIFFSEKTMKKKNAIILDRTSYGGIKYPAHVCKNCKKVIFEFE